MLLDFVLGRGQILRRSVLVTCPEGGETGVVVSGVEGRCLTVDRREAFEDAVVQRLP